MDERTKTSLLGMALLQGLVSVEALVKAATLAREHGQGPLEELADWGLLSPEDLEDLGSLLAARDRPGAGGPAVPEPPAPAEAPPPTDGRGVLEALRVPVWKQYRDLRFLGQGGMGRIFRAFDPVLKRTVALKFLNRDEPERLIRFVLEAQHQAKVDHPNICKVYEVGVWQGQSYIAMQFIRGMTLAAAHKDLTLPEIVRIMETVAEAIHAAHACGLVHRDLKPANIMVERDLRGPNPFVLDFGLARSQDAAGLTLHGQVMGTAGFMAPEQARALDPDVGFPADIYALGATLYALLGGNPPFSDSTGLELLRRTVEEDPPPLRKLRPQLPHDLETIVRKCMEKLPERRYLSALALAADLRRFREGEPILAHPPSLAYRLGKRIRKNRLLVAVSGLALALVLGAASLGVRARRTAATRALWAQRYGQEAERLEALLRYDHLLPVHAIHPALDQVRARLARLEQDGARTSSAVAGPAAYALGRGYLALGDVPAARAHLERALDMGFLAPEVAHVYGRTLGLQYQAELDRIRRLPDPAVRRTREQIAERQLRDQALVYLERGKDTPLEAPDYDLALLAFYGRRLDAALAATRKAYAQSPWFYEAKALEGEILLEQARGGGQPQVEAAIRCFQEARALAPSDPGLYDREARAWRQAMDQAASRGEDSQGPCDRGLRILDLERTVDPARPEIPALAAWFHWGIARYLESHGRNGEAFLDQALAEVDEALRRDPASLEALHARMSIGHSRGKRAYFAGRNPLPELARAVDAGHRALAAAPGDPAILQALAEVHLFVMSVEAFQGRPYLGSWEAAKALMEQGARTYPEVAAFHFGLGEALLHWAALEQVHDRDPARAVHEGIQALERALALEPASYLTAFFLGQAQQVLGEYQLEAHTDAVPALEQARARFLQARALKPDSDAVLMYLTETHTDLARAALAGGRSPMAELATSRALLREAWNSGPAPFRIFAATECGLVELRWRVRQPSPPEGLGPLFRRTDAQFRLAQPAVASQVTWTFGAEFYELWARHGNRAAIALGIQAARKALAIDPSYGPAHLRLGALLALVEGPGRQQARSAARAALARAAELDPLKSAEARALAGTLH